MFIDLNTVSGLLHFSHYNYNQVKRRQAFAFSGGPLYFSLQRSFRERSPITLISTMVFKLYCVQLYLKLSRLLYLIIIIFVSYLII